ncbi:hypothetical protein [Nostoc sp. MS1]|uniref:hypothetical protein n=1 Tax=Nostoc sp. MS1 TaxID=2764711 RepID=UPI001CC67CA1|nr:hypothetical protein [Nostoc sp. MS1]
MIKYCKLPKYFASLSLTAVFASNLAMSSATAQVATQSAFGPSVTFTCNDSEATIRAKNGPRVVMGTTSIYIGYQQVTSVNKDPRIIRFDNGVRTWCRSDYETTNDDGTGYGLMWDRGNVLYGVFTSTGTQTGNDFRRFSNGRWMPTYGSGGGAKVAVIARINPTNGDVNYATFLSGRKTSDGTSNSLSVLGLSWNGTNLTVLSDAWAFPRRPDRTSMSCTGSSPFKYVAVFTGDLTTMSGAAAIGCN